MNESRDIAESLSELERYAFLAVREAGQVQVQDVLRQLGEEGRVLAYTTVMTVLGRLWEKGFLVRRRVGKAYVYQARDQAGIAHDLGKRTTNEALARYGDLALSGFVDALTPEQRALVARLLAAAEEQHPDEGDDV